MLYRTLGSTGLRVSVIGVGTWQFGGEWNKTFTQPEVDAMFDAARERGITLVDTAECYGDHLSESLVGAALERDRQDWIIATKFGHVFDGIFKRKEPRSPRDILDQCERSLKALRTDYIDVYQYHSWGDDQFFDDDVLAVLHTLKDEGKVRSIGNSVGGSGNARQVEASKARKIESIQIVYNRLDRGPEAEEFVIAQREHLGVMARVPLASGYLSGKYKPGHVFEKNDTRSRRKDEERDRRLSEVSRIAREEVPAGVDMANWALAWCLRNPIVSCVIPGCMSAEQVKRNADAIALVDA